MPNTPAHRIIVHPAGSTRFYTWSQVSRNGSLLAVAPKVFNTTTLARRSAIRQVAALIDATVVVDEKFRRP